MQDRVFTHALATVRRLPRTGSSRPPPSARLRLYGLYKQSMEGDVESILPRPTLPTVSPDPNNSKSNNVHRYASRDLRIREAEAEIEKWDSWHGCAGMSKTDAKRRYIGTLIETMKEYASGTQEARELVAELEFVWNQIRSQSGSSEGEDADAESPTRRLERAGLKQTLSFDSNSPIQSAQARRSKGMGSRTASDPNRLRVLSPVSARDSDDVVETEEVDPDAEALIGPLPIRASSTSESEWRARIESHLRQLATEVAALREEMSANHLLSSSSLSPSLTSKRRRLLFRITSWGRWLAWVILRQAFATAIFVLLLIIWARWKRYKDRRVEQWVRRRWTDAELLVGRLRVWLGGAKIPFSLHPLSRSS